jgi:exonuclease SbcC
MKLETITLHNFLSHVDTDFELNGARLATLQGPNGAGKSSILDAVRYVLFDDARARTDQLVRLGSSEMSAAVTFTFAGDTYRVVRGRSSRAGGKSYLELHVAAPDGGEGPDWRPLTKDSIRETQAAIEELLRVDADTFATAAFLGQGQINRFAEVTAGERKRILATVLGLDRYERAKDRASELARDVDAKVTVTRDQVARLDEVIGDRQAHADAVDHYRGQLADLVEKRTEHTNELARFREERQALAVKEAELAATRTEVARLEADLDRHTTAWKASRQRGSVADQQRARARTTLAQADRIREAQERIPALEAELTAAKAAADEYQAAVAAQAAAVADRDMAAHDIKVAHERWLELSSQLSDTTICPECGAEIPAGGKALEERIDAAAAAHQTAGQTYAALPAVPDEPAKPDVDPWRLSEQLTEAKGIAAGAGALEEAQRIVDETTAAIATAEAEITAAEAAGRTARTALDAAKAKLAGDDTAAAIATVEWLIAAHETEIRRAEAEQAAATASLTRAEAALERVAEAEKERAELAASIEASAAEVALLRRLVAAFGANGIPARIIESILPELGRYANELLEQLRPGMNLDIRAQRAKRDGGMTEALDLVVRDDVGERPLALFSGGERMSVSLAIAVALSRLVARRAGTAIRTLVIDEPDGLDAEARRQFGQALRILAHAGELERVVLVSHHPDLADFGDAIYQVSRNGVGSVVELVA